MPELQVDGRSYPSALVSVTKPPVRDRKYTVPSLSKSMMGAVGTKSEDCDILKEERERRQDIDSFGALKSYELDCEGKMKGKYRVKHT